MATDPRPAPDPPPSPAAADEDDDWDDGERDREADRRIGEAVRDAVLAADPVRRASRTARRAIDAWVPTGEREGPAWLHRRVRVVSRHHSGRGSRVATVIGVEVCQPAPDGWLYRLEFADGESSMFDRDGFVPFDGAGGAAGRGGSS